MKDGGGSAQPSPSLQRMMQAAWTPPHSRACCGVRALLRQRARRSAHAASHRRQKAASLGRRGTLERSGTRGVVVLATGPGFGGRGGVGGASSVTPSSTVSTPAARRER